MSQNIYFFVKLPYRYRRIAGYYCQRFLIVMLLIQIWISHDININDLKTTVVISSWLIFFILSFTYLFEANYFSKILRLDFYLGLSLAIDWMLVLFCIQVNVEFAYTLVLVYIVVCFHSYYFPAYNKNWVNQNELSFFQINGANVSTLLLLCLIVYGFWETSARLVSIHAGFILLLAMGMRNFRWLRIKFRRSTKQIKNQSTETQKLKEIASINEYIRTTLPEILEISKINKQDELRAKLESIVQIIGKQFRFEYCTLGLIENTKLKDYKPFLNYNQLTNSQIRIVNKYLVREISTTFTGKVLESNVEYFDWNHNKHGDITKQKNHKQINFGSTLAGLVEYKQKLLRSRKIENLILLPLKDSANNKIGYLLIINKYEKDGDVTQGSLHEFEIKNLMFIVKQISLSIENYRFFNRAYEDKILINNLFNLTDINDVYTTLFKYFEQKYSSQLTTFWTPVENGFGEENTKLVVLRASSQDISDFKEIEPLRLGESLLAEQQYAKQIMEDVIIEPNVHFLETESHITSNIWAKTEATRLITIPLIKSRISAELKPFENIWGVICIRVSGFFEWRSETSKHLIVLSDNLSLIIERFIYKRRYYQLLELKESLKRTSYKDEEEFYNELVATINNILGTENTSLFLADEKKENLCLRATTANLIKNHTNDESIIWDIDDCIKNQKAIYALKPENSLASRVFNDGGIVVINELQPYPKGSSKFVEHSSLGENQNMIAACIEIEGKKVGVIRSLNKIKASADDITPLFSIADKEFMELLIGILNSFIGYFEFIKEREQFLHIVMHELKRPLHNIYHANSRIERKQKRSVQIDNHTLRGHINFLDDEAGMMNEVIRDMEYVYNEQSSIYNIIPHTDLYAYVSNLIRNYSARASTTKKIKISKNFISLPEIRVDKDKFDQVFSNLLKNAVAYSYSLENGGQDIRVIYQMVNKTFVTTNDLDQCAWHEFLFINRGIGVDKVDETRIWELYKRGSKANTMSVTGSGIGLYLCKQIMSKHGGYIKLEQASQPTIFSIRFPR